MREHSHTVNSGVTYGPAQGGAISAKICVFQGGFRSKFDKAKGRSVKIFKGLHLELRH